MLSPNLEKSLQRALASANERRHAYATLEHLLLALTEDQDAAAVLRACIVDLQKLRSDIIIYVDTELQSLYFHAALPHQFDEWIWLDETRAVHAITDAEARALPRAHPFAAHGPL